MPSRNPHDRDTWKQPTAMEPIDIEGAIGAGIQRLYGYDDNQSTLIDDEKQPLTQDHLGELQARFRDRFKIGEGIPDDRILPFLKQEYINAVAKSAGIDTGTPEGREAAIALSGKWQPHWQNPAQKYYTMAVADRGIGELEELFPEGGYDADRGELADHEVRHLVPPGQNPVIEAHRALEYWKTLTGNERPIEYSDIAIGEAEAANTTRDDLNNPFMGRGFLGSDTNQADRSLTDESGRLLPRGSYPEGANNFFAANHPIAQTGAQSPDSALTKITSFLNAPVEAFKYGVSAASEDSVPWYSKPSSFMENYGRGIQHWRQVNDKDWSTETPTSDTEPVLPNGQLDPNRKLNAAQRIGGLRKIADAAMPPQDQTWASALGVPDRYNTPVVGQIANVATDVFADWNGLGTVNRIRKGAGFMGDLVNEGLFNTAFLAGQEGVMDDQVPREKGHVGYGKTGSERASAYERDIGPALDYMENTLPHHYFKADAADKNPAFQGLVAKNEYLQQDRINKIREVREMEKARQQARLDAVNVETKKRHEGMKIGPSNYEGAF